MTRGSPNRRAGILLPSAPRVGSATRSKARKDAAPPDPFSIEQAAVDVTAAGGQLVEIGQAPVAAQVVGRVDHGLDPQRPRVRRVGPAGCPADPPSEPYVPLVAAYGSSKPRGRAGWCSAGF